MKGNRMASLSITRAWNETSEFVRREAGLLLPIAFMFFALPNAVLQLFRPDPAEPIAEQVRAVLALLPFSMVAGAIGLIGTIALTHLALQPGASVAEALRVGVRRFLPVLAAGLIVGLGLVAAIVLLIVLLGAVGAPAGPESLVRTALPFVLLLLLGFIGLWIRLMLMTPVGTVEAAGPIAIIRRSWDLTAGHFWKLLAFVVLAMIATIVIFMVVLFIAGILIFLVAGAPEHLSAAMIMMLIVTAVLQTVFAVFAVTIIARIYAQLAGDAEVSRVFT